MILDNDPGIDKVGVTIRAMTTRDVDDTIDAFRGWWGTVGRCVAFASARFLSAKLEVPAAKGSGLPMDFAPGLIELLTEATVLGFQLVQAAFQATDSALQPSDGAIAFDTARASGEYHNDRPLAVPEERNGNEVRCRDALA